MIEIIVSNKSKDLNILSCLSIKKNISKNIIFIYLINETDLFIKYFFITKYILLFLNIFIPIKITFIQLIPHDIINVLYFFKYSFVSFNIINTSELSYNIIQSIKKYNNILINYYPEINNNNILKKFIYMYCNNLTSEQILFFNYISKLDLTNKNNKYFIEGINLYNLDVDLLWSLSFEGISPINIFIEEGKNNN